MFDRFTDRARKVMGLAYQEAQRLCHDHIGTEHVLLGLLKEGSGVASDVLKSLDIDLNKFRVEVEGRIPLGNSILTGGQLPFTPQMKDVLKLALEEASNIGHNYIGTEHVLLGLLRQPKGIAADALKSAHVRLEEVRDEILDLLGAEEPMEQDSPPNAGLIDRLWAENARLRTRIEELEARLRELGFDPGETE